MNKLNNNNDEVNFVENLEFLSNLLQTNKHFNIINKHIQNQGLTFLFFVEEISDPSIKYAIKAQSILNIDMGNIDQDKLKQCQAEAQLIRQCCHQNVVDIHSDFEIGFYHFIQFNHCISTLDDWINQKLNQINDDLFLLYTNQIIDGIEYLHKKGLIVGNHLVSNILVTSDGVIKVSNFDFQKEFDDFSKKNLYSKNINCQFLQFPPELIEDVNSSKEQLIQTQKGDIWSLGVCLSILSGKKIEQFTDIQYQQLQTPNQLYQNNKSNKIVNYILNIDPFQRPNIQQIRQKVNQLYFRNLYEEYILKDQQIDKNSQQLNETVIERLIDFNSNQLDIIYEKYKQYEKIDPCNIDVLITLGYIEVKYHSNFSDSKKYFDKCIELSKNEIDAYLGLCMIIIQQRSFKSFKQAYDYLEYCLTIRQDYWRVYYIKSWLHFQSDSYNEGLIDLKISKTLKSDSVLLLSLELLYLLDYFGDRKKANKLIEKIINLNIDNDPQIFYRIGVSLKLSKIYNSQKLAIHYLQQSCKYNPKDLFTNQNLYLLINDQKESQKYLDILKLQYHQNSYFVSQIGKAEKDENKKLKLLQDSIQLDEENRFAYYYIAYHYEDKDRFDEAIKQYKKVLQFKPNDQQANQYLGYILAFKKYKFQQALQYYKIIMKQFIYETSTLKEIGRLYYHLEDYQKSIYYHKMCLQIDPEDNYSGNELSRMKKII